MKPTNSITCFLQSLAVATCAFFSTNPLLAQRAMPPVSDSDVAHLRQSIPAQATAKAAAPRRVLIYNLTRGTYHDEAIAWATRAMELMAEKTRAFTTTTSFDASVFTPEKLHEFDAVVMEYLLREKLAERGRKVLYNEQGERKDAGSVGDPKELLKVVRNNDWNDYHVIVRDNLILLRINDVVMSEVRDHDPRRALNGLLALQVHTGPVMKVQFRNIRLRQFSGTPEKK